MNPIISSLLSFYELFWWTNTVAYLILPEIKKIKNKTIHNI